MKIKKDQIVNVRHSRKGTFLGKALRAFDTEKEEWYPIAVGQKEPIQGASTGWEWVEGERIPCRAKFCELSLPEEG